MSKVWVKFEKESHFIEVPFYKKKCRSRAVANYWFEQDFDDAKENKHIVLSAVSSCPQAKFFNFGKNNCFMKTFTTFKNRIEVPFY